MSNRSKSAVLMAIAAADVGIGCAMFLKAVLALAGDSRFDLGAHVGGFVSIFLAVLCWRAATWIAEMEDDDDK